MRVKLPVIKKEISYDTWPIFKAMLEDIGLARQHLDSYNTFLEHGLQEVINAFKGFEIDTPKGKYEVIVGARRYEAAKAAGLKSIPAIIKQLDDGDAIATSLIENIQRGNLTDEEEIEAIHRGTLSVLRKTGVRFDSKKALKLFEKNLLSRYSVSDVILHMSRIRKVRSAKGWLMLEIPKKTETLLHKLDLHIT